MHTGTLVLSLAIITLVTACDGNNTTGGAGTASDTGTFQVDTAQPVDGTRTAHWVAVHVHCNKNDASVRISPWMRGLYKGDAMEWRFKGTGYNLDSVKITPKGGTVWPLTGGTSQGKPGSPARGGTVRMDATKGPHLYNIEFWCKTGTDSLHGIVDPDIIILDGD